MSWRYRTANQMEASLYVQGYNTPFNDPFSGTGSAGTRKEKPIWTLLKQEIVSGTGISWSICKYAPPRSRQITMPAPHHSVFNRPDVPLPNQQRQSTKGYCMYRVNRLKYWCRCVINTFTKQVDSISRDFLCHCPVAVARLVAEESVHIHG